jgi:hypothetical protein
MSAMLVKVLPRRFWRNIAAEDNGAKSFQTQEHRELQLTHGPLLHGAYHE